MRWTDGLEILRNMQQAKEIRVVSIVHSSELNSTELFATWQRKEKQSKTSQAL